MRFFPCCCVSLRLPIKCTAIQVMFRCFTYVSMHCEYLCQIAVLVIAKASSGRQSHLFYRLRVGEHGVCPHRDSSAESCCLS